MGKKNVIEIFEHVENVGRGLDKRDSIITTPMIKGVCQSCEYSQIMKRKSRNDIVVLCTELNQTPTMPDDIEFCNRFKDKNESSLFTMVEQAKILEKEFWKKRNRAGFQTDDNEAES